MTFRPDSRLLVTKGLQSALDLPQQRWALLLFRKQSLRTHFEHDAKVVYQGGAGMTTQQVAQNVSVAPANDRTAATRTGMVPPVPGLDEKRDRGQHEEFVGDFQ